MGKVYFSNLNGLRFLAALLVIIHHIEQFKQLLGQKNHFDIYWVRVIGPAGVILFFVLSGFLITYLLLTEQLETGTISIRNFYVRRVLRIWPLYYLIVMASFWIFPHLSLLGIPNLSNLLHQNFNAKFLMYLLFLPNLAATIYPPVAYASQAWSVGVEEQFYLLWPLLLKRIKNKLKLFYFIIIIILIIKLLFFFLAEKIIGKSTLAASILSFLNIDYMAIGGVFAFYLFNNNDILKWIFNRYIQVSALIILFFLLFSGFYIPIIAIHSDIFGILFGILIINSAANPKSIINLENKFFNYLGKISFGLYMFHPLAIVICLKLLTRAHITGMFATYFSSILLTIVFATISYIFLESYFIRKKTLFSGHKE